MLSGDDAGPLGRRPTRTSWRRPMRLALICRTSDYADGYGWGKLPLSSAASWSTLLVEDFHPVWLMIPVSHPVLYIPAYIPFYLPHRIPSEKSMV